MWKLLKNLLERRSSPLNLDGIVGPMTVVHPVAVTGVGPSLYRLDASLFLKAESDEDPDDSPRLADVMLTESVDAHTVRYVSVHERALYRRFGYIPSRATIESEATRSFLAEVVAEGGH